MRILVSAATLITVASGYLFLTALLLALTQDVVAANLTAGLSTLTAVLMLRSQLHSTLVSQQISQYHSAQQSRWWLTVGSALLSCWLSGQLGAELVSQQISSAGYEQAQQSMEASPAVLVLITAVIFAPLGEEALLRGVLYPVLRRHTVPLTAAVLTTAAFAALHGNIIQLIAVVPLSMLLCFCYEHTQRLREPIILHIGFNVLSVVVSPALIASVASVPVLILITAATVLLLITLRPVPAPALDER